MSQGFDKKLGLFSTRYLPKAFAVRGVADKLSDTISTVFSEGIGGDCSLSRPTSPKLNSIRGKPLSSASVGSARKSRLSGALAG